jgi:hypothetical protein
MKELQAVLDLPLAKVYVHLSDQQQDEAILRGYEKQKKKTEV